MKLHLEYTFAGKEVAEEFSIGNKAWAAMKDVAGKIAQLRDDLKARAEAIILEFYGERTWAGSNIDAVKVTLRPPTDSTSEDRQSYCRMFAAFCEASPRQVMIAKQMQALKTAVDAKDSATADFIKGGIDSLKESVRSEAKDLCVRVITFYAKAHADPTAPEAERTLPGAEERIRAVAADWGAALENPRGPLKLAHDAVLLRTAIYALEQVLAGKIKIPQATPQRDRSAEKVGEVRVLTAEEIAEQYGQVETA